MNSPTSAIQTFYLYGEPQRAVDDGFVHVESLDDRSRPSEWTIHPHRHRDLAQIILIAEGGGEMEAEGKALQFEAPCLLFVPVGIVHGFRWHSESAGSVLTLAQTWLDAMLRRDAGLSALFATPGVVVLDDSEARPVSDLIEQMKRELAWAAPGRVAAIEAALLQLLVMALRRRTLETQGAVQGGRRQAALVARFRAQVEARFRLREAVGVQARALGVSETSLRTACAAVAGVSPAALLDERAMLEARRLLLYSDLSVSEVGYAIGFEDSGYFSRFFSRHAGCAPRLWRARQRNA